MSASLFMIIIFLIIIALRVPVTIAMGVSGLAGLLWMGNIPLVVLPQQMGTGFYSFELLAVPFYIMAAEIMNQGKMTHKIFDFAQDAVGWISGGLAHVNILASMIFAGISGAMAADAAGLGKVEYEAMKNAGYRKPFAAAVSLASAVVGPIIPPSIMMIIYAVIAGVSVGKQLLAGLVPGVLIGLILMIYVYFIAKTKREKCPISAKPTMNKLSRSFLSALPAMLTPVIILVGITSGIVSPTEAGVMACIYCFVISFMSKGLTIIDIKPILIRTMRSSCLIMFIIGISMIMGWIVTRERVSVHLLEWALQLTENKYLLLIIINMFILIVGCIIETAPALLIVGPVLMPIITAIGIDPIHFGVILVFNLLIGMITPPVGLGLYIMCAVTKVRYESLVRASLPFFIPLILALLVITFFPPLSTFLPNLLMK